MRAQRRFLWLLLILACSQAPAEVYRWVDESGKVHYSDKKPEAAPEQAEEVEIRRSRNAIPQVRLLPAIRHPENAPAPAGLTVNRMGLDFGSSADYQDVQIGKLFVGDDCSLPAGDLSWNTGNVEAGLDRQTHALSSLRRTFERNNYRFSFGSGSGLGAPGREVEIDLDRLLFRGCLPEHQSSLGRLEAYVRLRWLVRDSATGEPRYEGRSEGVGAGAFISRDNSSIAAVVGEAYGMAANNILADADFVALLGEHESTQGARVAATEFDWVHLGLEFGDGAGRFRDRLPRLQGAAVTIVTGSGHGSGVLISGDGHILTNAHVVQHYDVVSVVYQGRNYSADVIRVNPQRDVAVLVPRSTLPQAAPAPIGRSEPAVGDPLFVIGTPLSEKLSHTVTSGIVSAKREERGQRYLQTDASINPGNSGGPVFNEKGELVGISVAGIFSAGGAGVGVSYLIPIGDVLDKLRLRAADPARR